MKTVTAVLNGDVKGSQAMPFELRQALMDKIRSIAQGSIGFVPQTTVPIATNGWHLPAQAQGDPVFRGDAFQIECYLADALKFMLCMRLLGISYPLTSTPPSQERRPLVIRMSMGVGEAPFTTGGYAAKYVLSGQGLDKKAPVAMQIHSQGPAAAELALMAVLLDTILEKLSPRQGLNLLLVLELGSLSAAAKAQQVSVSTISRSIAKPYFAIKQALERYAHLCHQGQIT